ncbi:hypothetical protein D3C84_1009570 [compost metagenome]
MWKRSGNQTQVFTSTVDGEYNILINYTLDGLPSPFDEGCKLSQSHLKAFTLKTIPTPHLQALDCSSAVRGFFVGGDILLQTFMQHSVVSVMIVTTSQQD